MLQQFIWAVESVPQRKTALEVPGPLITGAPKLDLTEQTGGHMTISVIVPVHNSELYLDECIESVMTGLNDDDELILVENGSTDRSWEMCREYAGKYSNIKAVQLDTAGVSRARNHGISLAEKYWITFLDSDDVMAPAFLEKAHEMSEDADIVIYSYCFLDEAEEHPEPENTGYRQISPDLLKRAALQFGKYQKQVKKEGDLDNVTVWSSCGRLIRRDLILENRIRFPEALYMSEDTAFSFQLYCCAGSILTCSQYAFFYRRTQNNFSRGSQPRLLVNNRYIRNWLYRYVKRKGIYQDLSEEVSVFLARKFIEECIFLQESDGRREENIQYVRENMSRSYMRRAVENAGYRYLIAGKKHTIIYAPYLWLLKRKLYSLLFIGSNKESV